MINAVIDLYHGSNVASFTQIKEAGVYGVIHKATQGITFQDSQYHVRRPEALAAGLLWGAYHFGQAGASGAEQADYFLDFVQPVSDDLLVLDFESYSANGKDETMTLQDAEQFVERVYAKTGRWPGLYSGPSFLARALGGTPSSTLSSCWLWIADYNPSPVVPEGWPYWTLWQYTDGVHGPEPHSVDGVGACDRDQFNGSLDDLRKLWGCEVTGTGA